MEIRYAENSFTKQLTNPFRESRALWWNCIFGLAYTIYDRPCFQLDPELESNYLWHI